MAEIDFSQAEKIYCNDNDVIEAYYNGNKIFGTEVSFPALNKVVYNYSVGADGKKYASASASNVYEFRGIADNSLKINNITIGIYNTVIPSKVFSKLVIPGNYSATFKDGTLTLTTTMRLSITSVPVTITAAGRTFDLQPA